MNLSPDGDGTNSNEKDSKVITPPPPSDEPVDPMPKKGKGNNPKVNP